jgi:hypothetical protein
MSETQRMLGKEWEVELERAAVRANGRKRSSRKPHTEVRGSHLERLGGATGMLRLWRLASDRLT